MSTPPSLPHAPFMSEAIEDDYAQLMRRHRNNVVNKSSKARPNKSQYGWGNLPADLINQILTLVNDTLVLDHVLYLGPRAVPIAEAVLQRQTLCSMRLVSSGWKAAVDSHPFWTTYLKSIRTDISPTEIEHLKGTPFEVAYTNTLLVCTACNLFNPPGHLNVARPDCRTTTAKLGKLQTCPTHDSSFCTNCLRFSHTGDIRLFPSETDDRDERGFLRPRHGVVCKFCREAAFTVALQQELARCARGGPLYGLTAPWRSTAAYENYVVWGLGPVQAMARMAVEDIFLYQNTRWADRVEDAMRLQHLILYLRTTFFKTRVFPPPTPEVAQFDVFVNALWDDDFADDDRPDIRVLYGGWMKDIAAGRYGLDELARDEWRLQGHSKHLCRMIRERLVEATITAWANERFYYGFWIMPSDEIEQLLTPDPAIHTPFRVINNEARRAVTDRADVGQSTEVWVRYVGRFKVPVVVNGRDRGIFLPPQSLLNLFDEQFTTILQRRLEVPLAELVAYYRYVEGLDDQYIEEQCNGYRTAELLDGLRRPDVWIDGRYTQLPRNAPSDAGGSTVVSEDETQPGSPRIEAVNDQDDQAPANMDFVIREGWGSVTDDDTLDEGEGDLEENNDEVFDASSPQSPAPEVEGSLGKRKQSEEEDEINAEDARVPLRPRLGSGQTSHSSSGETVNTTIVTPDDSPDLMASAIQLAVDEDPAMESINAAGVAPASRNNNPAPTSPSSSLGKRKLSDDEDGSSERPARRRGSRSGSSSPKAGSEKTDEGSEKTQGSEMTDEKAPVPDTTPTKIEAEMHDTVVASPASPVPAKQDSPPPDTNTLVDDAEELTESLTVSSESSVGPNPAPRKVLEEVHPDDEEATLSDSEYDDFDSSSESDLEEIEYGTPYVPRFSTQLGPRASEVLASSWWTARAPLRECHCSVCLRAKNEDMTRILLSSTWEQAVLRIA